MTELLCQSYVYNLFLLVSLELLEHKYATFLEQIFLQHSVMKTQTYKDTKQFTLTYRADQMEPEWNELSKHHWK